MNLALSGVAKTLGDQLLFHDVDLDVAPGEHVALIGRNGSGKSTLLRLLAGHDTPDEGSVWRGGRVAMLAQGALLPDEPLALAVTPPDLRGAREALARAEASLADPTEANLTAFALAEEHFRVLGGYEFEARVHEVLAGLNLDPSAHASRLSGGQVRRAMLARLLLTEADFLLLDEPTNHLDAASLAWLEGWVRASPAGIVVVSHDRAFLDATVEGVYELERGEMHAYPGGYTEAMAVKAELREAHERDYDAYRRRRAVLAQEMGRLRSKGESAGKFNHRRVGNTSPMAAKNKAESASRTYARRARAMEQRLDRMEVVEKPYEDRVRITIPLPEMTPGPSEVLRVQSLQMVRGEREVLSGLDLMLRRGERLALLGPNGAGKSTLIGAVLGHLSPTGGTVARGHGLTVYWAGQHGEELRGFVTLRDALLDAQPALKEGDLYPLLAGLGLPPDPNFALRDLSGGQRTRLSLARLGVTRAHLLVLDEPTNHLDVQAIEALESMLAAYGGTLLLASHDRRLVQRVATRTLLVGATPGS